MELKTVHLTSKGQITLPKAVREQTFKDCVKIAIVAFKDRVELLPADSDRAFLLGLQGSAKNAREMTKEERDRHAEEFVARPHKEGRR
jgi:bifunctional DNA-binding transcriptional regulator/antitoxin component of YhaV-PrlF toxin-antitoxin module